MLNLFSYIKLKFSAYFILLLLLFIPNIGWAQSCSITSITPMNFLNYSASAATPNDTTGSFTVNCGLVSLAFNIGIQLTSTGFLSNSGNNLSYQLYKDAARSQVWGTGANNKSVGITVLVPSTTQTVYGRIPTGQFKPPLSYTENVLITVTF